MKETVERTEGKTNLIYFNVWIPFLSTQSLRAAVEPPQRYTFLKFDFTPFPNTLSLGRSEFAI